MISIITPAFNASNLIEQTIKSVLAQTYTDWEFIIIDDCSQDDTVSVVEEFVKNDSSIKLIKQEVNQGVAAARNAGLEVAKGEFIAFLDSDDLWAPEKLEKQINFMKKNNCCFSYTMYQNFQTSNGSLGKIIKVPKKMRAKDILGNTAIGCLTVMVNRSMTGDFRMPLLGHTEDNCTWYEILNRGYEAMGIREVLAYYRVGNASLTKNKGNAAKQQWSTYRDYYKFSVVKSAYYFIQYAIHAVIKHF